METAWNSSDGLLLQALLLAAGQKGTTDLRGIISAADYIDHSILSREELKSGLRKLQAIGFAAEENGAYALTKKFSNALKKSGVLPKTIGKEGLCLV